jgi:hypothetical protein
MRDEIHAATLERPTAIKLSDRPEPQQIVGMYAVTEGTLQDAEAGVPYRTVRIESADRCRAGKLTYIMGRRVWIDANGQIERQSDHVRIMGFLPVAFVANPATARARAEMANEHCRYVRAASAPEGMTYSDWRKQQDARCLRILEDGQW